MKIQCNCGKIGEYRTREAALKDWWAASPTWTCPFCRILNKVEVSLLHVQDVECNLKNPETVKIHLNQIRNWLQDIKQITLKLRMKK